MITYTEDGGRNIPEEHVIWHTFFHAYGEIPYGFHVFVLDSADTVGSLIENSVNPAFARTILYDEPDGENSVGAVYFAQEWTYVGMVAHEALHLASWMMKVKHGASKALGVLGNEAEELAEMVGQLTSIMWYNMESADVVTVDD